MERRRWLKTVPAATLAAAWPALRAQGTLANRQIRYIVPVSAGGGSDMVGRTVTERWGKVLGATFVVDNVSGAGGTIACQTTARAAPDGTTLMQGYVSTHGTAPATRKVPYDPIKDFTPVGMIGATPNVLVVNASLPVHSLAEWIAHVRANPGRLSYGSAGQGSLTHLTMELFKLQANAFVVHIPYRGIAPAFNDLLGGQTQTMFPGLAAALPHIRSGRVRPLAVTGLKRHPLMKELPTLDESGFKGFDAQQWYGVMGPAAIPAAVVKQLNDTLDSVLQQADFREKLSVEAIEPMPMTPDMFGRFVQQDIARWTQIAKARNIQLDS